MNRAVPGTIAILWRGDHTTRRQATPHNSRFHRIFEELATLGLRAEPAVYDETFAARIGWKIDAVIRDLQRLGWKPMSCRLVDWGCGTGIATRRILAAWPDVPPRSAGLSSSPMLAVGEKVPDAQVWIGPRERVSVRELASDSPNRR